MKTRRLLSLTLATVMIFTCGCAKTAPDAENLVTENASDYTLIINEVCAKNKSILKDFSEEFPDWVEIYNSGKKAVDLTGIGLSDDVADPWKWTFPEISLGAEEYLVIFCSGKNTSNEQLHTNFKISSGETIYISTPNGKRIDALKIPALDDDESCVRASDGKYTVTGSPTPGLSNDAHFTVSSAPSFSQKSGFYSESFILNITAPEGSTVYYTLDGSAPTQSSKKYTSPITVTDRSKEKAVYTYKTGTIANVNDEQFPKEEFEKATIVRAIAVDAKGGESSVTTATYFVGGEIAKKYKDAAVISVVTDPKNLYDQKTGIFVAGDTFAKWRKENPDAELDGDAEGNYNRRGREWEREAHVDYFENGKLGFSEEAGIRTHGGWSRNSQQKSLKFYFREEYGNKKLRYALFEGNTDYVNGAEITEYKRFMIRNGGNDSFSLLYKDPWTQSLVKDFNFATQDDKPCVCFIDGEYWGLYTLMEVYDNHYIESNYGIDSSDAIMIKAGELEEGEPEDKDLWDEAYGFVRDNDMSDSENYEKACEYFDMDSLAEYIAFETYIGNEDWLWNNWAVFRSRSVSEKPYHDGRWRFMVYDTEYAMDLYGNGGNYKYDILTDLAGGDGHLGPIFKSLLSNAVFKSRFLKACDDMMNIAFNPNMASKALDTYHNLYSPYIEQHFKRYVFWQSLWGIEQNRESWKTWLIRRREYFPEQLKTVLNLDSALTYKLEIAVKFEGDGDIYIDGHKVSLTDGKWVGKFLPGHKVMVESMPSDGCKFVRYSGDVSGENSKIEIEVTKDTKITSEFY